MRQQPFSADEQAHDVLDDALPDLFGASDAACLRAVVPTPRDHLYFVLVVASDDVHRLSLPTKALPGPRYDGRVWVLDLPRHAESASRAYVLIADLYGRANTRLVFTSAVERDVFAAWGQRKEF